MSEKIPCQRCGTLVTEDIAEYCEDCGEILCENCLSRFGVCYSCQEEK